jgi:hypothetical protein
MSRSSNGSGAFVGLLCRLRPRRSLVLITTVGFVLEGG